MYIRLYIFDYVCVHARDRHTLHIHLFQFLRLGVCLGVWAGISWVPRHSNRCLSCGWTRGHAAAGWAADEIRPLERKVLTIAGARHVHDPKHHPSQVTVAVLQEQTPGTLL